MKFENSIYFNRLKHRKLVFPFGEFYLFENFIISELHEGIHFDWEKIQEVSYELIAHYGNKIKIGYISNRINSYSIDPHLWSAFNKEFGFIVASAVVIHDDFGYMNATLEKQFTKNSLKRCSSLEEAIHWIQNLDEFKT
ncbi:hypothetical protein [Hanstruepera flava]|uniref:hypothetical protein n=1 Tax=Hanstruepera flava TaxID=2930218 RepID=UPI002027DE2E|nr:hypothetical protein [Hanstruepera flava]